MTDRSAGTDLEPAREVADRAGDLVSDHVRAVIDTAQARADDLRADTAKAVGNLREDAHTAASSSLEALDGANVRLSQLVEELRANAKAAGEGR